jgi:hypothetical protein
MLSGGSPVSAGSGAAGHAPVIPSRDQRARALAYANEVRAWRKQMRRDLAENPSAGVWEIRCPHKRFASMRLFDLFAWMRVNERDMRRVCRACDVDSSTRLAQLTQRQRDALAQELSRRGL